MWQSGWWQQKWPTNESRWLHRSSDYPIPSRLSQWQIRTCAGWSNSSGCLHICWAEGDWCGEKTGRGPKFFEIWWWSCHWYGPWQAHVCWQCLRLSSSGLFCCLWHETVVGFIKASDKKAAGTNKVTKSAQRSQRLNEYYL